MWDCVHTMSQLVYLDTAPAMYRGGILNIERFCGYYLDEPDGKAFLRMRFGNIESEYLHWKELLGTAAQVYGDWAITDILNDNAPLQSGFYGCAFKSPDGPDVLAFRGSEMLGNPLYKNDYKNDLALGYEPKTPQHKMLDRFWWRIDPAAYSRGFYVTGHSLGGNLALYAAVTLPERVRGGLISCVAFNAPGFNHEFIRENAEGIGKAKALTVSIQNEYDIVSSLLESPVEPLIASSQIHPGNAPAIVDIMYPHSNFMFARDENGGFIKSESGEKSRLCKLIERISGMFLRLPRIIRHEVCGLVLDELYREPSPEQAKRYALVALSKYLTGRPV
ncbi:MAG: DUF2974 domain-containing protein, partial [Oscillospiraceae bacterium]|nr:DUF2974 domain-containing protein [Oscillospiraceae bacterium]